MRLGLGLGLGLGLVLGLGLGLGFGRHRLDREVLQRRAAHRPALAPPRPRQLLVHGHALGGSRGVEPHLARVRVRARARG